MNKVLVGVIYLHAFFKYFLHSVSIDFFFFAPHFRKHQLAFCDTIIQRNNRVKFASSSEPTLEAYFPFDPYLLKQ